MIFKTFLIITLLTTFYNYSESVKTQTNEPSTKCDQFLLEIEDSLLELLIMNSDLKNDYEKRNENNERCTMFLDKFMAILDQYMYDQQEQRTNNKRWLPEYKKKLRSKNKFNFKY